MGVHDGHRQRVIARFLESGFDGFEPHNIVETLLFFALPRRDTNEIAHVLMEEFGTLAGVLDAPYAELQRVNGVGPQAAALIKLIPEICRAYMVGKSEDTCLNTSDKAGRYILPRFIGRTEEVVFMICVDNKCRVLNTTLLHRGSVNSAEINLRRVVELALRHNASGVIVAHNHPGGIALPSPEDNATTARVRAALSAVGIVLIDHIIVADNDFVSLADSGNV